MLKLLRTTRPINIASCLQRSAFPLLGARYLLFSTSPLLPYKTVNTRYTNKLRLLSFVKTKNFDGLITALKDDFFPYLTYQDVLQHDFDILPKSEAEIKEKIVEIMEERGMAFGVGTIGPLLSIYVKAGDKKKADAILKIMKDNGIKRTPFVYSSLIKCHEGDLVKVESLFKEMIAEGIKPDVVLYASMINAFLKGGDAEKADELFSRMKDGGSMDFYSYRAIIDAYSNGGNQEKANEIFLMMKNEGINPPVQFLTWFNRWKIQNISKSPPIPLKCIVNKRVDKELTRVSKDVKRIERRRLWGQERD
jgi:pentatricopeptide repeat protein